MSNSLILSSLIAFETFMTDKLPLYWASIKSQYTSVTNSVTREMMYIFYVTLLTMTTMIYLLVKSRSGKAALNTLLNKMHMIEKHQNVLYNQQKEIAKQLKDFRPALESIWDDVDICVKQLKDFKPTLENISDGIDICANYVTEQETERCYSSQDYSLRKMEPLNQEESYF